MANYKSAIKRIRQAQTKRLRNRYQNKSARSAIKALREETNKETALENLPKVYGMIDKLAKKNIIHKNKASNLKRKLTLHVNSL